MTIKGNKGEWSEIYAFLRLLADGKLFAADEKLNRLRNTYFPIIEIVREDTRGMRYVYRHNTEAADVEIFLNGKQIMKIPATDFDIEAKRLLNFIKNGKGSSLCFPKTEAFLKDIHVEKLKAPSLDKSDINIRIHDTQTGYESVVGFSIKSTLGGQSTLLNASMATNFIYRIRGLEGGMASEIRSLDSYSAVEYAVDQNTMSKINSINTRRKFKDRIKTITNNGGELIFDSMENDTFSENLMMIDGHMPQIVATMLVGYYTEKATTCIELSEYVGKIDPLNRRRKNYEHNIREMLGAVALGMKPTTEWDGKDEASGGYIIVNPDGDVLAYHIHNRDAFKGYLLNNTKFDSPSGKRYGHCDLYEEEGELLVKLNLQIRFI